ncbi:hypothetical protein PBS_34430 [Paraburkholderia sp. 2C]
MVRDQETLNLLFDSITRFVRERLVPNEEIVAQTDRIADGLRQEMKDLGLFGLCLPEEYGGLGLTMEEEVLVAFELGKTSPAFRSAVGSNNGIGSTGIVRRYAGAEAEVSAVPRERRTDRVVLPDRAGGGFRCGIAAHERRARRRPLRAQRHQTVYHERARSRAVHRDGAYRSDGQARGCDLA